MTSQKYNNPEQILQSLALDCCCLSADILPSERIPKGPLGIKDHKNPVVVLPRTNVI